MKLIFAGTPSFAAPALLALLEAGHDIACVLTQPDRPAGRNLKLKKSAIKILSEKHHLNIWQPTTLKDSVLQAALSRLQADVMVVAAYGLILPKAVLDIPKQGCINIHASLLPRWRGAAPIQRAIEAGDKTTGITIMNMAVGLDTGDILCQHTLPILPEDNAATLTAKMANLGAEMIIHTLANLNHITPRQQTEDGACYAKKIDKPEREICWDQNAVTIVRKIHAFNPSPGMLTYLDSRLLKIWDATKDADKTTAKPGEIIALAANGITVATGTGAIRLTLLQMAGGNRLNAQAFIQGHPLQLGQRLGT